MKYKSKTAAIKRANADKKPQVHWEDNFVKEPEKGKALNKKSINDKKAKVAPINEENTKNFLIAGFESKDFTGLKEFLQELPLQEQIRILSVCKYAPFKWAAMSGEVEALSFITAIVPHVNARYMMYHDNYKAANGFIRLQRGEELMGTYNQEISITGFKIFAKIDYIALGEAVESIKYSSAKIKKDFVQAIEELKNSGEVDIDDKYLNEIKAKFGYAAADTTDEDSNSESDANTSTASTSSEDSEMSSNTPPESQSNLAKNDASQTDTNSLGQDSGLGSQQPLNLHVDKERHTQSSDAESSTDDLTSLILNHYLSWLKDLPEWLQEHFMNSQVIKDLIEYIESSNTKPENLVSLFNEPKEPKDLYSGNIENHQEELAEAKIDQADIEVPEDLTMANWLMSSVPTLHLPTEIAICALGNLGLSSTDGKGSGNIMPAACIAKLGYDAISNYLHSGNEVDGNLLPEFSNPISIEA
jgi:hypothetical protein